MQLKQLGKFYNIMEKLITILTMLGLILVGFLIAEFQNAWLGKQSKRNTVLSFLGVHFTQKDFQRLLFAIFLGIAVMVILPIASKWFNYSIDGNLAYLITGYSPSTIMLFLEKKIKKSTDKTTTE